jgi:hypothetical protein
LAYLLVSEIMILAGEALGRWKARLDEEEKQRINGAAGYENQLRLPFRTQRKPGMFMSISFDFSEGPLSKFL